MEALSKISDIISQLKRKKEDEEEIDISDLEITFMKILNVLKTGLEEEKTRFAKERTFQEEKEYEDELKHKEFLSVLKQFVSMQPLEKIDAVEEDKSSGILSFFKNLIETLKNFFKGFLLTKLMKIFGVLKNVFTKTIEIVGKLIKKIGQLMLRIVDFVKKMPWGKIFKNLGRILFNLVRFAGPIGLLLGAITGLSYLFGELVKKIPNMSALDYKQAEGLLKGTDKQIEEALKAQPLSLPEKYMKMPGSARQKVEAFVNDQKKLKLEELSKREGTGISLTPAEQKELDELRSFSALPTGREEPVKVQPRPEFSGVGAAWNSWNQRYFRYYDPSTGLKREKPTDEPIPTTQEELTRRRSQVQQTATPVRADISAVELNQKKEQADQTSQILTERIKELNANKQKLVQSKSSARGGRERFQIDQEIKKVDDEIVKAQKQLRDLQRGIATQVSVMPQTIIPEGIVSAQPAPVERAQPMPLTGLPEELTQPTTSATPVPLSQEQNIPSTSPVMPQSAVQVQEPNRTTNQFNTVNQENRMLELARTMSTNQMGESGTIVNNVGKTEVIPDVPLSVEASQRDDTHTLSVVLSRYKRSYV